MSRQAYAPSFIVCGLLAATALTPSSAYAGIYDSSLNDFGVTGLMQMPSARLASGDAAWFSLTHVNPYRHWVVGAKFTPWLEVAFRQTESLGAPVCLPSCIDEYWNKAFSLGRGEQVGRSLDIKILLRKESLYFPAIALGFQDMFGSGKFRGEYLVASKQRGPLDLTFGIGWGYLGSTDDVSNPMRLFGGGFKYRSQEALDSPQKAHKDWFKGQAVGFFGGVEYHTPLAGLSLKAEWSSIDPSNSFEPVTRKRSFPLGLGINWRPNSWLSSGVAFEDGNRVMFRLSLSADMTRALQPKPKYSVEAVTQEIRANALAQPVAPTIKLDAKLAELGYVIVGQKVDADRLYLNIAGSRTIPPLDIAESIFSIFPLGMKRLELSVNGRETHVITRSMVFDTHRTEYETKTLDEMEKSEIVVHRITTSLPRYTSVVDTALGQALARENTLNDDVKLVDVSVSDLGIELASISFLRAHLKKFSKGVLTGAELQSSSRIDAGPHKLNRTMHVAPKVNWSVGPEIEQQLGGDAVIKADIFARARVSLTLKHGIALTVGAKQRIAGNLDSLSQPMGEAGLPVVRSDLITYLNYDSPMIDDLTVSMTQALGNHFFVRAKAGIMETQFQAMGGEFVYMPPDALWALGGELYYAKKRRVGSIFDAEDYQVTTGHMSLYREFPDYSVGLKISAGRYLAGDWGMTLDLSREFDSGIRLGVYTTLTDAPRIGEIENNFVKGAYLSVPLNLFWGNERGAPFNFDFRKLLRNTGQKLSTGHSLYDQLQHGREWRIRQYWPK